MAKAIKRTKKKELSQKRPPEEITSPGRSVYKKHLGHKEHLCELSRQREMEKVAEAAKGARYLCFLCGRGAAENAPLCEPEEIL